MFSSEVRGETMARIVHENCWCVWEIEIKSNFTSDTEVFQKIVLMSDEELWRNTLREHNFDNEETARSFFNSKEVAPHHSYVSGISAHNIYVYNGLVLTYTEWGTFPDTRKIAYSNTTIIDCCVNTLDEPSTAEQVIQDNTANQNEENKQKGE